MWALIALISRKVFLKCKSRCKSKRARNKSAGLCTGLFEVSVQTIYFLLLEFFVEGGIDRDKSLASIMPFMSRIQRQQRNDFFYKLHLKRLIADLHKVAFELCMVEAFLADRIEQIRRAENHNEGRRQLYRRPAFHIRGRW